MGCSPGTDKHISWTVSVTNSGLPQHNKNSPSQDSWQLSQVHSKHNLSVIPPPASCNTGLYRALCWRGQHTHKVHLNMHSKRFLFHMEVLRAPIVYIKPRTVAAKRFMLSPGAHLSHACVPLSSNPGVGMLIFSAELQSASWLCSSYVDWEKVLFQELSIVDKNWSCLGGSELGSGIHPFKRNVVCLQPYGLQWSCQGTPP